MFIELKLPIKIVSLFFHHLFVFIHDWYSYCIWLKAEAAVFHSCILVYLALLCSAFGTSMVHIKCPLQAANITYLSCSLLPILCFFWGNIRYCQYWGQKNTIKELDSLVGYTDRNRMEIITIKHSVMCLGPNNKNLGDWTFINWKSKNWRTLENMQGSNYNYCDAIQKKNGKIPGYIKAGYLSTDQGY